ncbi:hypothetical protein R1flu_028256 [Riccia fluitans]|uniref:Uncharacterized protein n=1 Tax=Riccia fluitans TaxID=41844 RepID=A0ABD1XL55_9MARC
MTAPDIMYAHDAAEAWAILKTQYTVKNLAKQIALEQCFSNLRMADSSTISNFIREVRQLVNELALYGSKPSDKCIMAHVLHALPPRFHTLVSILSNDDVTPTLEKLAERLQLEEDRLRLKDDVLDNYALIMHIRSHILDRRHGRHRFSGPSSSHHHPSTPPASQM